MYASKIKSKVIPVLQHHCNRMVHEALKIEYRVLWTFTSNGDESFIRVFSH
jgi:hypothetical protein